MPSSHGVSREFKSRTAHHRVNKGLKNVRPFLLVAVPNKEIKARWKGGWAENGMLLESCGILPSFFFRFQAIYTLSLYPRDKALVI